MKKILLTLSFFAVLLISHKGFAQEKKEAEDIISKADSIGIAKYISDFKIEFPTVEAKQDFKKLRRYLNQKKIERDEFTYKLHSLGYIDNPEYYKQDIEKAKELIKGRKAEDVITESYSLDDLDGTYHDSYNYAPKTAGELEMYIQEMTTNVRELNLKIAKKKVLEKNIEAITDDIQQCEDEIDEALAPEYKNQDFRKGVSLNFTVLIGVLLLGFFFIIYKKSDNSIGKEFLGDNGLQFVTLFVLVIAIILFGILGILEGRELAAILSGISGYILGKGIDKTKPAPAPTPTPTPTMVPIVEGSPAPTDSDSANSNT
jgi:hypothetical protein